MREHIQLLYAAVSLAQIAGSLERAGYIALGRNSSHKDGIVFRIEAFGFLYFSGLGLGRSFQFIIALRVPLRVQNDVDRLAAGIGKPKRVVPRIRVLIPVL